MNLGASGYLLLLLPAVIAGLLLALWAIWRIDARRRFGGRLPVGAMALVAPALLVSAACVAAFAAARPQYGEKSTTVERRGIDLVVVLDVSQSMLATDVEPTRLARAQSEIASLLDRLSGDRAGLVIFAGEPFTRSPLTGDLVVLRTLVGGVHQERGLVTAGSDLGAAIQRGGDLLASGTADTKALLIVSDGEDHGGAVDAAIAGVAGLGVRVYTAGAGTVDGAVVLDADVNGVLRPRVGPDGAPVVTRLDADALRAMADSGGGRYVELGASGEQLAALSSELESLESTAFEREESSQPIERFQIAAAVALAIVLLATVVAAGPLRSLVRRGGRLLPLAGAGLMMAAICGTDAAEWNRRGNTQYNGGEYEAAIESYRRAQEMSPEERALYYNRANAFAALGEYVSAIDEAQRALPVDDAELEAIVEYALASHYANANQLRDALEGYKRSLRADPGDNDAKANHEIVERRLTPAPTTPTPTPPIEPSASPEDGNDPDDPGSTPEPGAGTPGTGTPQAGGTPAGTEDIPPEVLERLLEEALAGIDEEFTVEEALQVLELLSEQNRGQIDDPPPGSGGLPDY